MDSKKLIHTTTKDGHAISFHPEMIFAAQAGDTLNETTLMFITSAGMGQFFVRETHTAFCRKWEAALNGREAAQVTN